MRRLKSINVFFDPNQTSISEIENIPNLKDLVYGELYEALKEANSDRELATLFELNNSGYVIDLPKKDWVPALEKAISHFEKKEEYEKCALYKTLINQIYEQRNKPNKSNTTSNKQFTKRKNTAKKKETKKSNSR